MGFCSAKSNPLKHEKVTHFQGTWKEHSSKRTINFMPHQVLSKLFGSAEILDTAVDNYVINLNLSTFALEL